MSTRTIPFKKRERIVGDIANGMSRKEAAKKYRVSISTVRRLWVAYNTEEEGYLYYIEPRMRGGYHGKKSINECENIIFRLCINQSVTLAYIKQELLKHGHEYTISTISRFLKRNGIYKEACKEISPSSRKWRRR